VFLWYVKPAKSNRTMDYSARHRNSAPYSLSQRDALFLCSYISLNSLFNKFICRIFQVWGRVPSGEVSRRRRLRPIRRDDVRRRVQGRLRGRLRWDLTALDLYFTWVLVHIYLSICTYLLEYLYIFTWVLVHIYLSICTYLLEYLYIFTWVFLHIYLSICTYLLEYLYIFT